MLCRSIGGTAAQERDGLACHRTSGAIYVEMRTLKALTVAVIVGGFGCDSGPPRPITNERLKILTNTGFDHAFVDVRRPPLVTQLRFEGRNNAEFTKVLKCLLPIEKAGSRGLPDAEIGLHFELCYHAGMDPSRIPVRIEGGHLIYRIGEFTYVGGDAKTFKNLVAVKMRSEGLEPEFESTSNPGPSSDFPTTGLGQASGLQPQ